LMALYAAIDAGTNSTKMTIAEVGSDGELVAVASDYEPTRLGMAMQGGRISAAAISQAVTALCRFVALAGRYQVADIRAVATEFAREASNIGELQTAVRNACGLELEVISGVEEARLVYVAISRDFAARDLPLLVFNVGGGSTEVIYGNTEPEDKVSVPIGASSVARRFPNVTERLSKAELQEISEYIAKTIREQVSFLDKARAATLVGSGGTMTNLGAVDNAHSWGDASKVHLYPLPISRLRAVIAELAALDEQQRKKVPGLSPDRAGIIVSGGLIGLAIVEAVAASQLMVSLHNLRDGIIIEMARQK
jgi:exopolyphosphatase / guanosine-5'-triphosphate,3'-diphosphate pyrophosphatase